ncbi:hypothetical protein [Nocardioides sp.]|uniref:hypothetical protein n=1 Tax=Nocardioides sp. TaxID=35761 RepID=UPI002C1CE2A8|nr:hypothetical protein [Nocardioides sp.]HXH79275.1 hypothetical protein [Nocardioides sp.]
MSDLHDHANGWEGDDMVDSCHIYGGPVRILREIATRVCLNAVCETNEDRGTDSTQLP